MRSAVRLACCLLAVCPPLLLADAARAADAFAVDRVWFEKGPDGYAARADLQAGQHELLEKILRGGYAAQFVFELNFYQRREWLPDPVVGDISWRGTLSYDALTQRYWLVAGSGKRRFTSLAAAMAEVTRLRASPNSDSGYIKILRRGDIYLRARFYLSTENLPEPVQIGLLIDRTSELDSGWQTMVVEVEE